MENKAHYALVGAFVLIAMAIALAFIVWLAGAQFNQKFDEYQVNFDGPVRGLSQGSEVRFNGLNVGQVMSLRLDPDDPNKVIADIQVDPSTPVDTKSYGQLEPLGLTGLTYMQVFSGGDDAPLLKDTSKRPYRMMGRMSQIDTFLDDGGTVIEGAQKALQRINTVMSPDAIRDFQAILANIRRITAELDTSDFDMAKVNAALESVAKAGEDVSEASNAVTATAQTADAVMQKELKALIASTETTLDQLDKTLVSFEGAAADTDDLITDARDAINRLSNSGLTDLEETVDAIRRLMNSLARVADSLEQNPRQFIAGQERETVELPQ